MSAIKPNAGAKAQKNQCIQVFVRCRPLNNSELNQRNTSVIDVQGLKDILVQDRCHSKVTKTFSFDKAFASTATQADVYQTVVEPLISDVLSGFNCTVFAYGQTGSGKTYTMEGDFKTDSLFSEDSKAGVIPRALCALFDELRVLQVEYTVRISFMELYNEELYDLLSPDEIPPKLRLFDDGSKKGSVIVQGLQEVMVHTQSQVLDELSKGSAKRQVAATLMNAHSSRSHTIFSVTVHSKENSVHGEELLKNGKLNFVDLAGSENIGRSGSVDKRAREAASINQSLLTLSRVTACLVEHQPHVPYRESKLTRLLQDSLGGRTKTSLIATISPSYSNVDETLSTLDYALRAKSVANRPEVNQKVSRIVVMKEYMNVIEDLKKKLDLHRNGSGIYVNDENYKQCVQIIRDRNQEINDLIIKVRSAGLLKKTTEETFQACTKSLENHRLNLENINETINKNSEEMGIASETLVKVTNEREEAKSLLGTLADKENELRHQAEQLTKIAESSYADSNKIHDRLDFSRVVLVENQAVLKKLQETVKFNSEALKKMLSSLCAASEILLELLSATENLDLKSKKTLSKFCESSHAFLERLTTSINKAQESLNKMREQRREVAFKTSSDLIRLHLQNVENLKDAEKFLRIACTNHDSFVSDLTIQVNSFITLSNESIQNMKDVTQIHMNEMKGKLNSIQSESDRNIQIVVDLLHKLLLIRKVPHTKILNDIKLMTERTNDIKAIALKHCEDFASLKTDLLTGKEQEVKQMCSIMDHTVANIGYIEQQKIDISNLCSAVESEYSISTRPLLVGVEDFSNSVKETIYKSGRIVKETEEKENELLSHDYETPIQEVFMGSNNTLSESIVTLNNVLATFEDLVQETDLWAASVSSKFEELKETDKKYAQKEDEVLGMFLDGIQSTSSEMSEIIESGKTTVNQIVSTSISHDVQTGQTPTRKSFGDIPKCASLPSPIARKIKPRIKNASWKRFFPSPRKPLLSSRSLNVDDDCMASDSEITTVKKAPQFNCLQKSSSFSDLRSNTVFHRPRIPRKFTRKAL